MFSKAKKAFTIVELVIVIAVIAILMGIMFVGGTAISNNAKASTLDSDMRTFETNIKAMVNDPDANCIVTNATKGFDPTDTTVQTNKDAKVLLEKYFEGDMAVSGMATIEKAAAGADVSRAAVEGTIEMKDPYGMPYKLVILDDSDTNNTDITFFVYSFGKNKQTADDAGRLDADDVGFIVRVYDSVIYTGEIDGVKGSGTNGTSSASADSKPYKAAVESAAALS